VLSSIGHAYVGALQVFPARAPFIGARRIDGAWDQSGSRGQACDRQREPSVWWRDLEQWLTHAHDGEQAMAVTRGVVGVLGGGELAVTVAPAP
jgi:hypothetical protein